MSNTPSFKELSALLPGCLSKDQFSLKNQIKRLAAQKSTQPDKLTALQQKLLKSSSQVERRRASCPVIEYPDLPISAKRDEIAALIDKHQVIILCGETGSGK
ncbi:MAG: hypothetical protein AB1Y22_07455, partial [Cycloclasticus sp.]